MWTVSVAVSDPFLINQLFSWINYWKPLSLLMSLFIAGKHKWVFNAVLGSACDKLLADSKNRYSLAKLPLIFIYFTFQCSVRLSPTPVPSPIPLL